MTIEWWFAYLLTSIILSLKPGYGAITSMPTSINHGYRGAAAYLLHLLYSKAARARRQGCPWRVWPTSARLSAG